MTRGALAFALVLAACGREKATPASEPAEPNVVAPATDAGASRTTPAAGSSARDVAASTDLGLGAAVVHVPPGLAANDKVPLVVVLHGLGASSAAIEKYSDFASFARAKRIAWVAPDGPKDSKGRQFWNAGTSCCNFDEIEVDHVAALRGLVVRTLGMNPIDPKRVYFVGYSNGGFMAHRIACDLGGLVAGIVSVAGAGPGRKTDAPCAPTAPVRVLQVHGDADRIVNIEGGPLFADTSYPAHLSAARTASDWAARLECASKPKPAGTLDFEAKLTGAETKVSRFEACKRGTVELWTVVGGNHYIGLRQPSYEAMWKFLSGS